MNLPKKVTLTEVSPRDGLQNEKVFIPTEIKIQFIKLLADAGFSEASQVETFPVGHPDDCSRKSLNTDGKPVSLNVVAIR